MKKKMIKIAVIMGGRTAEHAVSLKSGEMIVNRLNPERYRVTPVIIDREGKWYLYSGFCRALPWSVHTASSKQRRYRPAGEAIASLMKKGLDVAFLALHGPYGEDGTIQGLMEMIGLPYTGSGVCASALAMDKIYSKEIYRARDLPVLPHVTVESREWFRNRATVIARVRRITGFPCVVKPAGLGSSIGIAFCHDAAGLREKTGEAFSVDDRILIEPCSRGRELTCAVLDTPGKDTPVTLPPTEIRPVERPYFDFHAKYTPGATREITPAPISTALTRRVQRLALAAHRALGCRGMSRTDMIVGRHGKIALLETNTIPGMTETSLLPQAAKEYGLSFPALLDRIIAVALERFDADPLRPRRRRPRRR